MLPAMLQKQTIKQEIWNYWQTALYNAFKFFICWQSGEGKITCV